MGIMLVIAIVLLGNAGVLVWNIDRLVAGLGDIGFGVVACLFQGAMEIYGFAILTRLLTAK